jgi:hypothetical protein
MTKEREKMLRISKKLNIVVPVTRDDGVEIYVHSSPIAREVFERYHQVIAKTFSAIYGSGYGTISGPRIAALLLRDAAVELGQWDGEDGVEAGLINEMRRLSNVLMPSANGWDTVPIDEAISRGYLSEDDAAEVNNVIAFFTVASAMHKKNEIGSILDAVGKLWGAQTTSFNVTEYGLSLRTSIKDANIGEKDVTTQSSIPS